MPQIDYAKLAEETNLKDARSASAAWGPIKRKFFSVASAQASPTSGPANKVIKTPRKPKEPKTPTSTKTSAAKPAAKVKEEEAESPSEEGADDDGDDDDEDESKVKVEVTVAYGVDSLSAAKVETNHDEAPTEDADGDSTMIDTPESIDKGEVKPSVADEMSGGEMSPSTTAPAPAKAKKVATPKSNAMPKTAKTPKTPKTPIGEAANTTPSGATETPVSGPSSVKKHGRKTKAEKEAEATAAGEHGITEHGDEDEADKPVKKARKTPIKKAKLEVGVEGANTVGAGEGEDGTKEKPAKKPRKPAVKKGTNDDAAPNGHGSPAREVVKEKQKPGPKPGASKTKKEEDAAPADGESSEVAKGKKKPGPKPGAAKGKKVEKTVEPSEATDDAQLQEADQETVDQVVEAAKAANDVLAGKKIETKIVTYVVVVPRLPTGSSPLLHASKAWLTDCYFSTTAPVNPPNWGTTINSSSPSTSKSEATAQLGSELAAATGMTIDETDVDTIVVASEVMESIEIDEEEDDGGDTISVATE